MFTLFVCLVVVGLSVAAVVGTTLGEEIKPATTRRRPVGTDGGDGTDGGQPRSGAGSGPTRSPAPQPAVVPARPGAVPWQPPPPPAPAVAPLAPSPSPVPPRPAATPPGPAVPTAGAPGAAAPASVARPVAVALPRPRRVRSTLALLGLLAIVGALLALVVGAVMTLLALGLRSTVT